MDNMRSIYKRESGADNVLSLCHFPHISESSFPFESRDLSSAAAILFSPSASTTTGSAVISSGDDVTDEPRAISSGMLDRSRWLPVMLPSTVRRRLNTGPTTLCRGDDRDQAGYRGWKVSSGPPVGANCVSGS